MCSSPLTRLCQIPIKKAPRKRCTFTNHESRNLEVFSTGACRGETNPRIPQLTQVIYLTIDSNKSHTCCFMVIPKRVTVFS